MVNPSQTFQYRPETYPKPNESLINKDKTIATADTTKRCSQCQSLGHFTINCPAKVPYMDDDSKDNCELEEDIYEPPSNEFMFDDEDHDDTSSLLRDDSIPTIPSNEESDCS